MAGRKIRDAQDARACLRAAAASGLARSEWARRHDIDGRSLNGWRVALGRGATETGSGPRLVELVSPQVAQPPPLRVCCGAFVVEVTPDFDDKTLARVLSVLGSC